MKVLVLPDFFGVVAGSLNLIKETKNSFDIIYVDYKHLSVE